MSLTVNMIIVEYRGQGQGRHLHLKKQAPPPRVSISGETEVNWNVSVDSNTDPTQIGLTAVTIWFPHVSPLFIQSPEIPIPVREVTIRLSSSGSGTARLTLNRNFDLSGAGTSDFVMPFAIYCTVDGGHVGSSANPANPAFEQRGRQMIDGHHSHPECNVGP